MYECRCDERKKRIYIFFFSTFAFGFFFFQGGGDAAYKSVFPKQSARIVLPLFQYRRVPVSASSNHHGVTKMNCIAEMKDHWPRLDCDVLMHRLYAQ
jgi:hypothetical protein